MILRAITSLGRRVREWLENLGYATRMAFDMLKLSGGLLRRPRLITDQIHFIGNYSLVIIAVSGLFVGFVLGFQGITRSINTARNRRSACWLPCR